MNHKFVTFRLFVVGIFVAVAMVGLLYVDQAVANIKISDQSVLFSDDFGGDLSKWSDPIGPWYIDQGELVGQGLGGGINGYIYAGDPSWTDYSFQAKLIFINNNAMMVLRSTGNFQNEYYIELWGQGGEYDNTYVIAKFHDAVQYDLGGGHIYSPVPITNPCVVNVQVSGNRLFLYINGILVNEIDDPNPLTNGRVGLGVVWNYSARFDDVLVTTLPPIMMLPPEQDKFVMPGNSFTYTIELGNHTGGTDSFNLDVLPGNSWATSLITDVVGPIADGGSITFTATMDVPTSAHPGDFDVATIQAISVNKPSDSATTTLKTTATSNELAYVPMGNSNALTLIDTQIHTTIGSIDMAQYGCMSPQRSRLNPEGTELYVMCNGSQNIVILETTNLSWVASIDRLGQCEQDVAFMRSGSYALASGHGCSGGVYPIDVIDTVTHSIIQSIDTSNYEIISINSHPYLPLAYAASVQCCWSGGIFVINTNNFTVETIIPYPGMVWDVQPSPDGKWVYASEYFGNGLAKIDVKTNTVVDTLPGYGKFGLDISPDGSTVYASEMWDGVVHVIDTSDMELITTIGIGATTAEPELNCDGSELYVARDAASIPVIDTQNYNITHDIPIPGSSSAYGIAICPQYAGDINTLKTVDQHHVPPGAVVNYKITTSNLITDTIDGVLITDTLPMPLTYREGSLSATSGIVNYQDGVITWTGSIFASTTLTVSFGATVSPTAIIGSQITNQAVISAEGEIYQRSASIDIVPYKVYVPCAFRACLPTFKDDFSNQASGWAIESGDGYWMGYQDGGYYIAVEKDWIAWSVQDFGVSDFQIEVDAWPGLNLNGGTAIMFSATEYGFYLFEINDGWYSVWRNDSYNWTWTPLIDWTYSPAIHPGLQVNRMKVVRIGSNITVYANGQKLGSVNDGTYQGTWSGLVSEAYLGYFDGRFDNFAIYTGNCIGTQSAAIPLNRSATFDAIFFKPGSGHSGP